MTTTQQNFKTYAGDSCRPTFQVFNSNGQTIDISTVSQIEWDAKRDADSAAVLTKTLTDAQIAMPNGGTDGLFYVILTGDDTTPLGGFYIHTARITDAEGNVSTITLGGMEMGQRATTTASYSGDPDSSPKDAVRFLIYDTDTDSPLYSDAEIAGFLSMFGGPMYAAAAGARAQAAKFSGLATKRVGDLSISYGQVAANWRAMAATYQQQADLGGAVYTSGISKSDMATYRPCENPNNVGAFTTLKAFDNRGASGGFMPPNTGGD